MLSIHLAGERRRYRRALLGSSGQPSALGRRLLQLPSLTPSVAEAAQTTLEAVDVTLLLVAASAAQVLRSWLRAPCCVLRAPSSVLCASSGRLTS